MSEEQSPLCELYLKVWNDECTAEERLAFEQHLAGCPDCQADMEELETVWGALYTDMEYIKPPDDLKEQVLNAAWAAGREEQNSVIEEPVIVQPARVRRKRNRWPWATAAALILLAGQSAWILTDKHQQSHGPLPIEQALSVSASQIQEAVPLYSATPGSGVNGIACIVDNGSSKQFVVYVYGAAATIGAEAYQVWLVKDGVRQSAGTFRVTEQNNGIGVLAMPIGSDHLSFDKIGITLEPDDKGSQPRGQRILAS